MTEKSKFKNAERHQLSILTPLEKRTLRWLADRMPAWVNSDHLTLLGFAGMILTGASYYMAQYNPLFLVLGIVCLAINWFGDSLDGTLARVRNRQRPRYGFYVDHIVDAFGVSFVVAGLGLSGYMSPTVAMGFLIAYFLRRDGSHGTSHHRLHRESRTPHQEERAHRRGLLSVVRCERRCRDRRPAGHRHCVFHKEHEASLQRRTPSVKPGLAAWLRFNAVGIVGVGVQLAVLAVLRSGFDWTLRAATLIAVECAVLHNFVWHERWTWKHRALAFREFPRRLLRFNVSNGLISIVGNLVLMELLTVRLHLNYMLSSLVAIGVCSLLNFFISDKLVFK
jgi:putative flippase GtrA